MHQLCTAHTLYYQQVTTHSHELNWPEKLTDATGPSGGPLSFGSFEAPVPTQQSQSGSQTQGRSGPGPYSAQQAMPQQQSQQQPQGQPRRNQQNRNHRPGLHEANSYSMQRGPPSMQQGHFNASQNTYMQSGQQGFAYGQPPNMQYGMPAGYGNAMVGGQYYQQYQQQPQPGRSQSQSSSYQRSAPHSRPQQPQANVQPAVPSLPVGQVNRPKTKALDIIDPNTHTKVEISPRSESLSTHGMTLAQAH